jgi:hypothetical protein
MESGNNIFSCHFNRCEGPDIMLLFSYTLHDVWTLTSIKMTGKKYYYLIGGVVVVLFLHTT